MIRPSRCAKLAAAVLGAALTGSCAGGPPAPMVSNRTWAPHHTGYVFRTGYYSRAELADPRWERGRRDMRQMTRFCDPATERVVRRDVRWYPATPTSGRRCAALVYTVQCQRANPMVRRPAEDIRRELLATEPARAIERDCGSKDYYRFHPEDCARVRYRPPACQRHLEDGTLRPVE